MTHQTRHNARAIMQRSVIQHFMTRHRVAAICCAGATAVALTLAATSMARAQDKAQGTMPPAHDVAPPKLDQKACADRAQGGSDAKETQGTAPKEPLSDELARSNGVICPPSELDPDIHVPAPGGGRTPVIPPPGSPGGDPSVQPK